MESSSAQVSHHETKEWVPHISNNPTLRAYLRPPKAWLHALGTRAVPSPSTPLHAGRDRSVDSAVHRRASPQAWDPSDPVVQEMKLSLRGGASRSVQRLRDLNQEVRQLCDAFAEYIGSHEDLLSRLALARPGVGADVLGVPASRFPSSEDYAFFVTLTVVNTHILEHIFKPFHPAASGDENNTYSLLYQSKTNTESQIVAGAWRAKTFQIIDSRACHLKLGLLRAVRESIMTALTSVLWGSLPCMEHLPTTLPSQLQAVLDTAYEWNVAVKTEVVKYDLEPYLPPPRAVWDPVRMTSFERVSRVIRPGSTIISAVTFGLDGSVSLGGRRVSHVQQKSAVLLEEWFIDEPTMPDHDVISTPRVPTDTSLRAFLPATTPMSQSDTLCQPTSPSFASRTQSKETRTHHPQEVGDPPPASKGFIYSCWASLVRLLGWDRSPL